MLNADKNIKIMSKGKSEESVDELLAKLAQKGKKVKLIDDDGL
jgi:septum formation inhibitor-activating ATPase MinD